MDVYDNNGDGILELRNSTNAQNVFLNSNGNSWIKSGNLGVGTNTPYAKLHVEDTGLNSISFIVGDRTNNGGSSIYFAKGPTLFSPINIQ
jgi:hypothetical protein